VQEPAGGTVANDLARQFGVLYVHSATTTFASTLAASPLVESVGAGFSWQGVAAAAPEPVDDPGEALQWDMRPRPELDHLRSGRPGCRHAGCDRRPLARCREEKAGYSNYGTGANDAAAPGGNGTTGDCTRTILSTFPGSSYFCIQGTSMASPHAAGVAALIVSEYGTLGADGDVKLSPTRVESYLQGTAIDQGLPG